MELSNRGEAPYRLPGIPEARPFGETWRKRLDEWRALVKTPAITELAQVLAGGVGELSLRETLGRHQSSRFGEVFGGKRVPKDAANASAGRYEIDLLVVTPRRIVAFEAKHWSGKLRSLGARWEYERRTGEIQVFDDLAEYNAEKLACLQRYLKAEGLDLPSTRFEQQVVFTHPRIELDQHLRSHPRIVTVNQLSNALPRVSASISRTAYLLSALIERCASHDTTSKLVDGLPGVNYLDGLASIILSGAVGRFDHCLLRIA